MRTVDLIEKKKQGLEHSEEEINFLITEMMAGKIPDYQISAWLMAVCFRGLNLKETTYLTKAMIKSGDILDLSKISDNIVDKHSTGGVGDKITLILIPILQALNIPIMKLSGRGLGYTGGTIDKLESIPNFNCQLSMEKIFSQVKEIHAAISSQTPNLTPADAKLYALRDVTATVANKGLIASSVISKKIASGANFIVLDVKYGSGAFIKTKEEAQELSEIMVHVAKKLGRNVSAVISSMDDPLGHAVGNALEVIEVIECLKGNFPKDLEKLTFTLAKILLLKINPELSDSKVLEMIKETITSRKALDCLKILIEKQGGNSDVIDNYKLFPTAKNKFEIKSLQFGYINSIDALMIAKASKLLGAGRDKKEDNIDYSAGVYLNKKSGDFVNVGDIIAVLNYNDVSLEHLNNAKMYTEKAFSVDTQKAIKPDLIYKIID